jgi:autotransporter-associated beta strand protein
VVGANYVKWTNISLNNLYIHFNETDFGAIQLVQAELLAITITGDPGSPADWGTGTTWDLGGPIPSAAHDAKVRHSVTLAAGTGPQTIASLALDNANSDLRIATGASLTTGAATVQNGALTVNGALNTKLTVSGGSATLAAGTTGISALTVSGTGTVNTAAAVSVPTVTVSGGSLNAGSGHLTTATLTVTGGTANVTDATISQKLAIGTEAVVTVSATNTFKVTGTDLANSAVARTLTLQGGTVTLAYPPALPIAFSSPTTQAKSNDQFGTRPAYRTIDGSGMTPATPPYSTAGTGSDNETWQTNSTTEPDFPTTYIAWDLGSSVTLDKAHVWNCNHLNNTNRGIKFADLYISDSAAAWADPTNLSNWTFVKRADNGDAANGWSKATGATTYTGFDDTSDFAGLSGKYVMLRNITNWGGTRAGLSEISFYPAFDPTVNLPNTNIAAASSSTLDLGASSKDHTLGDLTLSGSGTTLTLSGAQSVSFNNITATDTSSIAAGVPISLRNGDVTVASGKTLTVNPAIGNGTAATALNKLDSGTLVLMSANTHTGATTVNAGTLKLTGSGSIANSQTITVASGATLDTSDFGTWALTSGQTLKGNGTVNGPVTV